MLRARQAHLTQNQYTEHFTEYSYVDVGIIPQTNNRRASHSLSGVGATTLISAGILILAIWSATLVFKRAPTGAGNFRTPASASTQAPVLSQAGYNAADRPLISSMVRSGPLDLYHWSAGCPLENARSLRPDSAGRTTYSRTRLTRRNAELTGLRACRYCEEVGF